MSRRHKIFQILGCLLILGGLGVMLFSQFLAQKAQTVATQTVEKICAILPPRSLGVAQMHSNQEMPVLQVAGKDFIGLIEIPAFGKILPIFSSWEASKVTSYPCRFWGSAYDGTLIIGGADQQGQFDFLDQVELGSVIKVVDMTGAEYVYSVTRVDRSKTAEAEALMDDDADLTLFARDAYSMEYVIVRCKA